MSDLSTLKIEANLFGLGSSTLAVTRSVLSAEAILGEVRSAYEIGPSATCQLAQRGMNDTYLLSSHSGRYAARVYRSGWRSPSEILYELELLNHLAARGVSVSLPVAAKDGNLVRYLAAPEGPRPLVLFSYKEGKPLSWDNVEHCRLIGQMAAMIHSASDDFVSQQSRFRLDLEYLIDAPLAALHPFLAHRVEDWRHLEGLAERLRERVEAADRVGLEWGICHGNLKDRNMHVDTDGTLTILDFDFSASGWRAYDLAVSQYYARQRNGKTLVDSFYEGYSGKRGLASSDWGMVPVFCFIHHLWNVGLMAANAALWGAIRLGENSLDRTVKSFRQWEAEHQGSLSSIRIPHTPIGRFTASAGDPPKQPVKPSLVCCSNSDSSASSQSCAVRGLFAITYSTLASDAVLKEVAGAYAIGTPAACQLLRPGSNDTYLLTTPKRRYAVRVYRAGWRTPSDIAYELDLLLHLAAKGISVSVPIPAEDGSLMHPCSAPEGTRQLALFTYVEGTPASWDDECHCYLVGRAAAQFHTASDDFASPHNRFRLDSTSLIDAPLTAIRPFLSHRSKDYCWLERFAVKLRAQAEEAASAGLDWGVCHGDYGCKNILIKNFCPTVLDFDHCGLGWRVYDFAPAYRSTANGTTRNWQSFLQGYNETRSLKVADLAAVPLLRVLRSLYMLGVFADNASYWGTTHINDTNLGSWLDFFRQWEAEHLKN